MLEDWFEKYNSEYSNFEDIKNPPSNRPDLCAFILLDKLVPSKCYLISAAEHDEIWLDVGIEELSKVATEADVKYLVCCEIRFDGESLAMFI